MRVVDALALVVVGFGTLVGCISFHEEKPVDWGARLSSSQMNVTTSQDMQVVLQSQVVVVSRSGSGAVRGLGVPLSPTRIATVAHVVNHLGAGENVKILHVPAVGGRVTEWDARLAYVSAETEVAVLDVLGAGIPESYVPNFCSKSIGGNATIVLKPYLANGRYTSSRLFSGYVTSVTQLPRVTDEFDETAKKSGFSPKRMEGQRRIVAVSVSDATVGNSGGAIYDVEQRCVLGLVSMVAEVDDFAFPAQLRREIGLPSNDLRGDHRPLLFSIPATAYPKE